MILEIGCGENKVYEHSLGLDVRKTSEVDVVADSRRLPFDDRVFDLVFSSHSIEHISHCEARATLAEWIRVIRPGGRIEIICPDLRARAAIFVVRPTWHGIVDIYGKQDYPQNSHLSGYSYGLLKRLLQELGVTHVRRIIDGYRGIPFIPNSLHVLGEKTEGPEGSREKNEGGFEVRRKDSPKKRFADKIAAFLYGDLNEVYAPRIHRGATRDIHGHHISPISTSFSRRREHDSMTTGFLARRSKPSEIVGKRTKSFDLCFR